MGIDPSIIDLHYRFAHHCQLLNRSSGGGGTFTSSTRTYQQPVR
jgi:hypothetical protein